MGTDLAILYTTIDSLEKAEGLARQAIEARLAACINILPGMRSIYRWNGAVEASEENSMIFKTSANMLPMLERWLLQHHPYDTPAILKWSAASSEPFYQFINNNL